MKQLLYLSVVIFLSGCVTVGSSNDPESNMMAKQPDDLTSIDLVRVGMSISEVKDIMGKTVKVGYQHSKNMTGAFEPIELKSPYKKESFSVEERPYEALFFFTDIQKADGVVSNEELTPLVFVDKKLIGIGWEYYYDLKKQSE